jgi:sensor c-di-GMP phosphodiesterase-like protein
VILHSVQARLAEYAERLVRQGEDMAVEIGTVLHQANASSYTACSSQDIAFLRRLTFGSRFLKDVGRVHQGNFMCSATTGKLAQPRPLLAPDAIMTNGARIYLSYPLVVPSGDHAQIVMDHDADAVLSPDIFLDFPQEPYRYAVGLRSESITPTTDWSTAKPGLPASNQENSVRSEPAPELAFLFTAAGGRVSVPAAPLQRPAAVEIGGALYQARCSRTYPLCAVTSISLQEIWRINHRLLWGYLATGGLAGASCALVMTFSGKKRRSQSLQLKRAILTGKLSVVYQPIVDMASHVIIGAEALARWTDEDGESIRPETIVALAEAEGFISEITRFVVTRAFDELSAIFATHPSFRLHVNLAPSDLADPRLLILLDEKLTENPLGIRAHNLTFELPERATSSREIAVAAIHRLRMRGHRIFIDDFGTGYSNLAYLTELDVDGIKINRSFIATVGTESVTASIVPQILAVAKALSLQVVVQGIERQEQATYFANSRQPMLGQGWFFGLPVPARSLIYLCAEKSE